MSVLILRLQRTADAQKTLDASNCHESSQTQPVNFNHIPFSLKYISNHIREPFILQSSNDPFRSDCFYGTKSAVAIYITFFKFLNGHCNILRLGPFEG